jgi:hypothetical protein
MKRLFIVLTLGIIYLTSRYLHTIEEEKHTYVASLLKYHYVVESVKEKMRIPLYISDSNHDLTLIENIDRIQLKNDVMIFDVALISIEMSHQETKDDMTYYMFEYEVLIPRFNLDMYLENIILIMTTTIGLIHEFRIGTLEIFIKPDVFDSTWSNIEAVRHTDVLSIHYMNIVTEATINVFISQHINTELKATSRGFQMLIPVSHILFLDIPIMIQTNEDKEMIVGIQWISSKRILSQAEGYYVIYHLYKDQSRETL